MSGVAVELNTEGDISYIAWTNGEKVALYKAERVNRHCHSTLLPNSLVPISRIDQLRLSWDKISLLLHEALPLLQRYCC